MHHVEQSTCVPGKRACGVAGSCASLLACSYGHNATWTMQYRTLNTRPMAMGSAMARPRPQPRSLCKQRKRCCSGTCSGGGAVCKLLALLPGAVLTRTLTPQCQGQHVLHTAVYGQLVTRWAVRSLRFELGLPRCAGATIRSDLDDHNKQTSCLPSCCKRLDARLCAGRRRQCPGRMQH